MGTPQFAVVCLKRLFEDNFDIVAVVTAADKPVGRGLKIQSSPVKREAEQLGIPLLQPDNLRDPGFISQIEAYQPDLIVVVAFRILPEILFSIPTYGAINLHGSLLPKYRGAAPINWAIINGEKESGVTTFFLQQKVDTGNIISQDKIDITPNMTAGELHDKMAVVGSDVLSRTIHLIARGDVKTAHQDESKVTKAPKLHPQDCLIDFNQSVERVHNFVRGLSPKPGAYTYLQGKRIQLFETRIIDSVTVSNLPGVLVAVDEKEQMVIQCNPGWLSVGELKAEGKKRMRVGDYLRGQKLDLGSQFGS